MIIGKNSIWLLIVLVTAIFFRFWQIGNLPQGIANDESTYIYSAYSIARTGHDIAGKFLPLSINVDSSLSPVPVYLAVPFVGLAGVSAASGRFVFALLGVGVVLLTFLIAKELSKNTYISFASAMIFAVSPWHTVVSRGAWDGGVAIFFYLLGIYIFLKNYSKGNINWALPAFLLAFFSYHATKVFFVLFIPVLIFVFWSNLKVRKKEVLLFFAGLIMIVAAFFVILKTQGVSRQDALFFNDEQHQNIAAKEVNFQRDKNTAPFEMRAIFDNKISYNIRIMIEKYVEAFSPQYLFTVGDINPVAGYGIFLKGAMYVIDLPLLLLGLYFLSQHKNKRVAILIVVGLLIAPLPTVVAAGKTYFIRGLMMLPFLTIISGCGAYYLFSLLKEKNKAIFSIVLILFVFIYAASVIRFGYRYYYQFNTVGSEYWNSSTRDLSLYIGERKNKYKNIYVSRALIIVPLQYGLYNQVDPAKVSEQWNNRSSKSIDNISFLPDCIRGGADDPNIFLSNSTLYVAPPECHTAFGSTKDILDPLEPLRKIWRIYEKP